MLGGDWVTITPLRKIGMAGAASKGGSINSVGMEHGVEGQRHHAEPAILAQLRLVGVNRVLD